MDNLSLSHTKYRCSTNHFTDITKDINTKFYGISEGKEYAQNIGQTPNLQGK